MILADQRKAIDSSSTMLIRTMPGCFSVPLKTATAPYWPTPYSPSPVGVLSPVSIQTQSLALASSQSRLPLLRPSIPIVWRLRLLRELAVFVYATHATQAIAFEWKPGFTLCQFMSPRIGQGPSIANGRKVVSNYIPTTVLVNYFLTTSARSPVMFPSFLLLVYWYSDIVKLSHYFSKLNTLS